MSNNEKNKLPSWAVPPKQRGVIATSKGWVLESTGEILKRVNDLPTRLKALMRELVGSLDTIKEDNAPVYVTEVVVDPSSIEPSVDINTQAPVDAVANVSPETPITPEVEVETTQEQSTEGSSDAKVDPQEVAINTDEGNQKKRRGRKPKAAKETNETDEG